MNKSAFYRFLQDFTPGLIVALLIVLITSCVAQKRLDRLIKNHPELAKTDSVYSTKSIDLPGFSLDTNFKASTDVYGLSELVEVYKDYLDSLKRVKLTSEIKNYIINRECLKDTFTVKLANNGFCKFWQSGNLFYYQINEPKQKINFTVPVSVNKVDAVIKYEWRFFWIGLSVGYCSILILQALFKNFKP